MKSDKLRDDPSTYRCAHQFVPSSTDATYNNNYWRLPSFLCCWYYNPFHIFRWTFSWLKNEKSEIRFNSNRNRVAGRFVFEISGKVHKHLIVDDKRRLLISCTRTITGKIVGTRSPSLLHLLPSDGLDRNDGRADWWPRVGVSPPCRLFAFVSSSSFADYWFIYLVSTRLPS